MRDDTFKESAYVYFMCFTAIEKKKTHIFNTMWHLISEIVVQ
jgi:hypothetical protein